MSRMNFSFSVSAPSPFFGEEFGFQVPRDFRQLVFYVMVTDCLPLSRDLKLGRVAIDKEALVKVGVGVLC